MSLKPLLPGALSGRGQPMTLGVMGGGQLGRMFVQAAQAMGYFTAVLDPDASSPAGRISHHHVHADYMDADGLSRLGNLCQATTTEFENVPAAALTLLANENPRLRTQLDTYRAQQTEAARAMVLPPAP